MLRRISEHDDPSLVAIVPLRPRLEAAPRTGVGLPSLSVGRHPSNDVVLNSTGIPLLLSRFHSSITFDGEQFTLVDRVNTNGTYVRAPTQRAAARSCACTHVTCAVCRIAAHTFVLLQRCCGVLCLPLLLHSFPSSPGERRPAASLGTAHLARWRHRVVRWTCKCACGSRKGALLPGRKATIGPENREHCVSTRAARVTPEPSQDAAASSSVCACPLLSDALLLRSSWSSCPFTGPP